MPRGDRTGPLGLGPRTGRGFGFCNGYNIAGFRQGFRGRCFRGRGFGIAPFSPTPWSEAQAYPASSEKEYLKKELNFLENQILNLKEKLKRLEATD